MPDGRTSKVAQQRTVRDSSVRRTARDSSHCAEGWVMRLTGCCRSSPRVSPSAKSIRRWQELARRPRTIPEWRVGLGAEFALTHTWFVKAEYLYVRLESYSCGTCALASAASVSFQANILRGGLNYK